MKLEIAPGTRYGKLTYLAPAECTRFEAQTAKGLFACDCGKQRRIRLNDVVGGRTRSCGCAAQDACRAWMRGHYASITGKRAAK